ncbi:hypothetical protein HDU93_009562 [Gonapodya sp. JEL0774]|nr:hypothetical protein HDU93_009562 [Gonapodya sp. JEL0774]
MAVTLPEFEIRQYIPDSPKCVLVSLSCPDVPSASVALGSIQQQTFLDDRHNISIVLLIDADAYNSDNVDESLLPVTGAWLNEASNVGVHLMWSKSPHWNFVQRRREAHYFISNTLAPCPSALHSSRDTAILYLDGCQSFVSNDAVATMLKALIAADLSSDDGIVKDAGTETCWMRPGALVRHENGTFEELPTMQWNAYEFALFASDFQFESSNKFERLNLSSPSYVYDARQLFLESAAVVGWTVCLAELWQEDLSNEPYSTPRQALRSMWIRMATAHVWGMDLPVPLLFHNYHLFVGPTESTTFVEELPGLPPLRTFSRLKRLWSPAISVIVPFYNVWEENWLRETLDSLASQSFSDFEVIIINDGSDAAAEAMLRQVLGPQRTGGLFWYPPSNNDTVDPSCMPVRLVGHWRNMGLSETRNTGVILSKSEYVIFLDPDDYLDQMALEKLAITVRQRITTDTDAYSLPKPKNRRSGYRTSFVYTGVVHFGDHEDTVYAEYSAQRLRKENYLTATAAITKASFLQVGGMCSREKIRYFEDWEFWVRLAAFGHIGSLLREPLFHYRRHTLGNSAAIKIISPNDSIVHDEVRKNNPSFFGDFDSSELSTIVQSRWTSKPPGNESTGRTMFLPCYQPLDSKQRHVPLFSRYHREKRKSILERFVGNTMKAQGPLLSHAATYPIFPFNPTFHQVKPHRFVVLYVLPWMTMGGADLYDLEALRAIKKMHSTAHIVLVVARHLADHPWEKVFRTVANEIWHLQTMTNNTAHQDAILDYLAVSRKASLLIVSRAEAGYSAAERWHGSTDIPGVPAIDILHMPSPNSVSDWEWRSGRSSWALEGRVTASAHLRSYLINNVRAGHQNIGQPSPVEHQSLGRPFADPITEDRKLRAIRPPFVPPDGGYADPSDVSDLVRTGPLVLFLGRLDEQKDPLLWLDIGALVVRGAGKTKPPRLVVAGGGPMEREVMERLYMRARCRAEGIDGSKTCSDPPDFHQFVDLLGPQTRNNVTRILARGDSVLLSTSRNEGIPLTFIEAAAYGVPTVTLRCGGVEEIYTNSEKLKAVPGGDDAPGAFRHMLGSLIDADCATVGKAGVLERARISRAMAREVLWWLEEKPFRGDSQLEQKMRNTSLDVQQRFGVDRFQKEWGELIQDVLHRTKPS